jgi:DNA polymerase I-like protein with 3'-5' exonuclease and polymerase domains
MIQIEDFNFNVRSNPQMQEFLYEFLELKPIKETKKGGNYSTDEEVIKTYADQGIEFCTLLIQYRKLHKALSTYVYDIKRNVFEDGMIHHELWLMIAETFRSSSTDPNLQNIPKHGFIIPGIMWKIIRKIFVRLGPDWLLGEVDYDGAEVKCAAMIGGDPQLIEDVNNDMDMHSHWAIKLFGLKGYSYEQIKEIYGENERFLAKNNFTFATLFGAGNKSVAIEMRKSKFYETYVRKFYDQRSIKRETWNSYYVDFSDAHVEKCQNEFYTRYHVHKKWQDITVDAFYKNGYVDNPFGFRRRYPLARNEIINHPIQSTSFLLLLDSLISIDKELINNNWQTHLNNQIHDSGMANINKYEAGDFIDMANDKMVNKPHLPWTQKVKMKTDWEFGHNWLDMKRVKSAASETILF